jgi:glutamate synthase (NADPH/NADH) small chain
MKACPTHIDIATFIKKIATGNVKGAAKTILESNWVPLTCAKACPVDVLCEGACVYNERGETPIQIGRLQRDAMEWFYEHMPALFTPAPKNGKSVGIIGSGPAGLACGAELAMLGYDVLIYEGKSVPGGLDTWGIAPYKMTQEDSLKEVRLVENLGVKIMTNMGVGRDITVEQLASRHDAVFIGIGLSQRTRMQIPGEDLEGVVDARDFIEAVTKRRWPQVEVGRRVAVIGGGNTAIDAATEAHRLGAEQVMMIYRRSKEEIPAYDFEVELARKDEVIFHWLTAPVAVKGKKSVEGLQCVRMQLGKPDASGRRSPERMPGSEFEIPLDMIIRSVGSVTSEDLLRSIPGLKIIGGRVVVDDETLQTTNPKFFAGGDCINGGKEVVNAAADGKQAAHGIHSWIFG